MRAEPMSTFVKRRLQTAAQRLGTTDPVPLVGGLFDRSFSLPAGSPEYGANSLMPGAVPLEPSFSEQESGALRFTMVPLPPGASAAARQQEATREMRRLVAPAFGGEALRWFDERSEEWRGTGGFSRGSFGAYFSTSFDEDGLLASKVYYELRPEDLDALPPGVRALVRTALSVLPGLVPVFTLIKCGRSCGNQRVTFYHRGPLALARLGQLMQPLGLAHQLPSVMQLVGLALGGRFDLPEGSVVLGLGPGRDGAELKLEVLLGRIPDLPTSFLDLLALGLAERPRELHALQRWLAAFTPDQAEWPGRFSVLSLRTTRDTPARVSLYLRPIEFELRNVPAAAPSAEPQPAYS